MVTIEIKEDLDDPKERKRLSLIHAHNSSSPNNRRAAAKRKQKEAEAAAATKRTVKSLIFLYFLCTWIWRNICENIYFNVGDLTTRYNQFQTNQFTEEDIRGLVKTFKMDFPAGNINKRATVEIIRRVFPR